MRKTSPAWSSPGLPSASSTAFQSGSVARAVITEHSVSTTTPTRIKSFRVSFRMRGISFLPLPARVVSRTDRPLRAVPVEGGAVARRQERADDDGVLAAIRGEVDIGFSDEGARDAGESPDGGDT